MPKHSEATGDELHVPFKYGLDANKAASPLAGQWYWATDTDIVYRCKTAGVWESYLPAAVKGSNISFIIDGGGEAITTGVKGYVRVPFNCAIVKSTLLADQSGSIKVDIWKDTYTNFPPLDADSICGGYEPEISSGTKDEDVTLSGWTTAITAGSVLAFNVDSIAAITRCLVSLDVNRT
ncbi:MAG: hypothetical protein KKH94_09540 [Candidatus Omnitrophica bacterium]|nr:hypothetical protein [Candidatus Omnitrophota bacterium]